MPVLRSSVPHLTENQMSATPAQHKCAGAIEIEMLGLWSTVECGVYEFTL